MLFKLSLFALKTISFGRKGLFVGEIVTNASVNNLAKSINKFGVCKVETKKN